jgi:hypothetical protein
MAVPDWNAPKRSELIAKYADRPVNHYYQFDGFVHAPHDDILRPDEDGDALFAGETYELMAYNFGVRVLIPDSISPRDAARTLTKVADWVERDLGRMRQASEARRRGEGTTGEVPF